MTIDEKMLAMRDGIAPDVAEDNVLKSELLAAESMILNKMYPFGYEESMEVPPRYEQLQIKLAIELYTQRGAEGQVSMSENGITRTWTTESRLLSQIVPHCGSVMHNA